MRFAFRPMLHRRLLFSNSKVTLGCVVDNERFYQRNIKNAHFTAYINKLVNGHVSSLPLSLTLSLFPFSPATFFCAFKFSSCRLLRCAPKNPFSRNSHCAVNNLFLPHFVRFSHSKKHFFFRCCFVLNTSCFGKSICDDEAAAAQTTNEKKVLRK